MRRCLLLPCVTWFAIASACSSDHEAQATALPYKPNATTVIGGGVSAASAHVGDTGVGSDDKGTGGDDIPSAVVVGTPNADECLDFLDGECVQPQEECGDDGTADVLLDDSGAVIDVICYPSGGVSVEAFEGDVHDVGNNVVLVFDDANDGADVTGDVTVDGNNVTLWGYGPDVSVLDGDLTIDKNNAVVRGIRVQGDVVIDKNNPSLIDCVIEGDLTIRGNNVNVALCEVWGTLTVEGNNAALVANEFENAPVVKGKNLRCADNVMFEDGNQDRAVSADEIGDPVTCGGKDVKAL